MRVFTLRDFHNEYKSVNFAVAAEGFKVMGWEVIGYQHLDEILPLLERDDLVVDYKGGMRRVLEHFDVQYASITTYPDELIGFLGRDIWQSTINTIASSPELWPIFVKPRDDAKKFTGVLVRNPGDLIGCGDQTIDTPIWCSYPIKFISEWRCFVRYGEILDVRPYKGDWRQHFDYRVIEQSVERWRSKPQGCALDFGLDSEGRTLLIEVNDGFSLGSYGLEPRDYARLLSARWSELLGTRDYCDF